MTLTLEERLAEAQAMFNAIERIANDQTRDGLIILDLCEIGVRLLSDAVDAANEIELGAAK